MILQVSETSLLQNETLMQKFLFEQAPIVVILIFGLIWLYKILNGTLKEREKYFTEVIGKRDKVIDDKDELLRKQGEKMTEVLSANTRAMYDLQKSIESFQNRH